MNACHAVTDVQRRGWNLSFSETALFDIHLHVNWCVWISQNDLGVNEREVVSWSQTVFGCCGIRLSAALPLEPLH